MTAPNFFLDEETPNFFDSPVEKNEEEEVKKPNFFAESKEKTPDFFEKPEQQKIPIPEILEKGVENKGFWKNMFEKTGEAFSYQARIGEVKTPEQVKVIKDFGKEILSSATFAQSERIEGLKTDPESDSKEVGNIIGTLLPIVGYERAVLEPLLNVLSKAGKAMKYINPFIRAAGWGVFGATKKGAEDLVKEGELPTAKELVKEGAKWALLDGTLQGAGVALEFGMAIHNIAQSEGMTHKATLAKLFRAIKNKGFDMFKKPPTAENILNTVEELTQQATKKVPTTIDITPKEPPVKTSKLIVPPEVKVEPQIISESPVAKNPISEVVKAPPKTEKAVKIPESSLSGSMTKQELAKEQQAAKTKESVKPEKKVNEKVKYEQAKTVASVDEETRKLIGMPEKTDILVDSKGKIIEESKPISAKVYRGSGEGRLISTLNDENILGDAKYYALNEDAARQYGKDIETKQVKLDKPFILDSDVVLKRELEKLGFEVPMLEEDIPSAYKALSKELKKNYDGVIVQLPILSDVNGRGEPIKRIREHFDDSQIVVFPKNKLVVKPKPKPKPIAKPTPKPTGEATVTSRSKKLNNQLDEVLVNADGTILEKSQPIELDLFRGTGGGGKVLFYENVLGEAEYYALSEKTASDYGKKVIKKNVSLSNPLVLNSDKDLKKVWNKRFAPQSEDLQELRQNILDAGHDGVVVHAKERLAFNSNDKGECIKVLNNMFGDSQVVVFPKNELVVKSTPKPKPIAKPIAKPKQPEDIITQKVARERIQRRSTPEETMTRAATEPSEIHSPPVFGDAENELSFLQRQRQRLPRSLRKKSPLNKKMWSIREDYYGKRWGLNMRYRQKFDTLLKNKKMTAEALEDMIYHIEDPEAIGQLRTDKGTGNPFLGQDDTWDDLSKRLTREQKEATKEVKKHFAEMLKILNDSPYVKDINPREFLEQIYVPHFYEGKTDVLYKVLDKKPFSTSNPLANMRKYNTFNIALREAGFVPKYRNIIDLLNHYDALMIRVLTNSELVGQIKEIENEMGERLIARPNNKKLYKQARADGWVEFTDPFLRRRVVGTGKNDKPIFATSEANALVHPDLAESLEGIFSKEAYKPENLLMRAYDWYNDQVRAFRVKWLPAFHMGALSESFSGAAGLKGWKKLTTEWDKVFLDHELNEFAAESGLKFGIPTDTAKKGRGALFAKTLSKIELLGGKKGSTAKNTRKFFEKLEVGSDFMFNELHPRMKMITFNDYLAYAERRALKKGIPMTPEWRKLAGREIAKIVNDQFGGQAFEVMRVFGNPDNVKIARRSISYVDWTLSALRQMSAIFTDIPQMITGQGRSLRGDLARRYNLRYLAITIAFSQFMSYLNTGLKNNKDENGKDIPNSVTWDYDKAHSTFENKDPKHSGYLSQAFHFQLPDIKFEVAGIEMNPGRDAKGRRRYSHAGKQFLEVPRWFSDFEQQLYNKSTPAIQFILPFMTGSTPGEGEWKPRGVWKGGGTVPWDGTDPWTIERSYSKAKFFGEKSLTHFGIKAFIDNPDASPFVFFNTFPVSKGISLTGSEGYYKTYYRVIFGKGYNEKARKEAQNRVEQLDRVLRDQKYNMKQINRKKTSAKKELTSKQL